jgi:hypothetical protein
VAQGQIAKPELDAIVGAVSMLGGQRFRPADMVPPSWQQYVLTRDQAIEQGYIPKPEVV